MRSLRDQGRESSFAIAPVVPIYKIFMLIEICIHCLRFWDILGDFGTFLEICVHLWRFGGVCQHFVDISGFLDYCLVGI